MSTLKHQLKTLATKLMRAGLAEVHGRLDSIELMAAARAKEQRAREPRPPALWRGGLGGAATGPAGTIDHDATRKYHDELSYWVAVARGQDPAFPGDFHEVFATWQRTRLKELADQLKLDPAAFEAWCAQRTAIEIGGGPHPAVSEARWKRAIAVDPLVQGYAAEGLFPAPSPGSAGEGGVRASSPTPSPNSPPHAETSLPVAASCPASRVIHLAAVGESIPLPSATADLIIIENCLDHVEDPQRVAAEIARLLRPGALVWLLVDLMEYQDHLHPNPMSEPRLRALMTAAGFEALYLASWPGASHPQATAQCRSLWKKK